MKLHQLNLLCSLEQYRSFSKTATHLFISQPALSTSIKSLEEELQCKLLIRSNRGVQFTPVGKIALEKAHDILNEIVLIRSIAKDTEKISEELCIASNTFRCLNLLARVFRQINIKNAEATINLQELDEHELIHQLLYGTLDFALLQNNIPQVHKNHKILQNIPQLSLIELTSEPLVVLVSKNHPLATHSSISIYDLFSYPVVTAQKETDDHLFQELYKMGYEKKSLEIHDTLSLDQFIAESNYWTFIPLSEVARHRNNPNNALECLHLNDFSCYCVINWLSNTNKPFDEEALLLQTVQHFLNEQEAVL